MQRPPFPQHPHQRRHALARVAGAAGAAALIATLLACRAGEAEHAPPSALPSAVASTGAGVAATDRPATPSPITQAAEPTPAPPPPPTTARPRPPGSSDSLPVVRAQLDTMLENASSCQVDTECHSIAVGAKACGGPEGYRAYSDKKTDPATIDALAQHERDLAQIEARASGRVSNCLMYADPGARCEKNKCVTGNAHGGRGDALTR